MTVREKEVTTDVLVIGGGMAGCFAAIKAREAGREVVLVDKGYVSKSARRPTPATRRCSIRRGVTTSTRG